MKRRLCAFILALMMIAGIMPVFSRSASAAESTEKVLIDWNCDIIDFDTVKVSGNNYPNYYFADFTTQGVEKGTVHMGGDGNPTGYAAMVLQNEMTSAAVTLEMDMKVDSLMTQMANPMFRGVIIEFPLPENKLLYIVLQDMGMPDGNGNNATIRVSRRDRSADNAYNEKIAIPTDGNFHKWVFQYDGKDMLRLVIDGEVIKDFPEVDVFHDGASTGRLQIKNVMADMAVGSGTNSITFDHIKLTEGTTLAYNKVESVFVAPDASAEKFTVTANLNSVVSGALVTISVYPRGEVEKAVTRLYTPNAKTFTATLEGIPFSGIVTVAVNYTGAQPYTFDYYLPSAYRTVSADTAVYAEQPNAAYVFRDLGKSVLPANSAWYTFDYETATGNGSAICTPAVDTVSSVTLPATLHGKFAVYVGYFEGSRYITVNGANAALGATNGAGSNIHEAFASAVDLNGQKVTIANTPGAAARIAYVKFVSLSESQYAIAIAADLDDSHTFITDNDGFSTLCTNAHGNYINLFKDDFITPYEKIDQKQFIWCTFSTSMLNYDSEVWWEYVTKRLKELNIPQEKWPEDFLDHVDTEGNALDFSDIMRTVDVNAFNNMRSLNETGYPHEVLSNMMEEKIEGGEFYVSLRMSHYNGGGFAFQTGALFYLHPEWKREGGNQFSYMYDEYRAYLHDILIEMAQPENVDGILMDFGRYYYIFGNELTDIAARTEIMNEFVKSVHDDMPEGKKLTVRVLDPVYEKATVWGLDYKHWVEQCWVDRVYISCQSHETFFDFQDYIDYFDEHPEVDLYLGINATLSGHDLTKEEEEILQSGGTIQKGERVDDISIMLRVYDFYNAGADGVFTFNWGSSNPMFRNVQNAARMKRWYNFLYPTMLMSAQPAKIIETGGERIIFDYNCDSLSSSLVKLGNNAYPDYYFADHELDAAVPEGQIYIGGEAKESNGYASLLIPTTGAGAAYTLKMDLKIENLMIPAKLPTWRGLTFEVTNPNAPLLYFTLIGTADGNAEIHLSQKSRAGNDIVKTITLPKDDKFHTWAIDFDGKGGVTFSIDETVILFTDGIVAQPSKAVSQIDIKNIMVDIGSGYNSVYIDNISMTSFVESSGSTPEGGEPGGSIMEGQAAVTVEARAQVLPLPVSDAEWANALTIEQSANPNNYRAHGKTAAVTYKFDKAAKKLHLGVDFNLNSWLYDLVVTDAAGRRLTITSDRAWGAAKAGCTLWSHSYADNGYADAIKVLNLTVENVTELPDKLVLFASNCATNITFTAKMIINLSDTSAAEIASGTCGENLTWKLTDDGTLTISGTGKMTEWNSTSAIPWCANREAIKKIVIENGVTSIGWGAFYGCSNLTSITIPEGVTSIGSSAFANCPNLTITGYTGSAAETYAGENNIPFVSLGVVPAAPAAIVSTEAPAIAVQGSLFTYTVSLAGTYDGFAFEMYPCDGMAITGITAASSNINVDNLGDRWLVSVLGGLDKTDAAKENVITVTAQVAADAAVGERKLTLANVMLSDDLGERVTNVQYEYAAVQITDQIPGDINGDFVFNYYDVARLYAFFRGKITLDPWVITDINGDGTFNYYDVTKLYAIFRGKAVFE